MLSALRAELASLPAGPPALRKFGLVVGAVLAALGGWLAWREAGARVLATTPGPAAAILVGIGLALLVMGALFPARLRQPYLAWMALALAMGFVTTRLLLTAVFFGIVTPIALAMRLGRKDPMRRRPDPKAATYWIDRDPQDATRSRLEKYW